MSIFQYLNVFGSTIFLAALNLIIDPVLAQTATPNQIPERIPTIQEPLKVPSILPQKEEPILEPPPIETIPPEMREENQLTFRVKRFVFEGNTIFNNEQLETVVAPFTRKEITLSELLEARTAITNFYVERSFVTDNGFLLSTELRITAWAGERGELQVIPFFNFGTAWNNDGASTETEDFTGTLASVGLGLQYQLGDRFNARLDWGVPLFSIDTNTDSRTWQENGVYFSIGYRLF
ncbi:BamA/TamA family outer membrane protein [Nostoc sp. CHAB 5836]|uniref:POTRA domain-containing protein n=1 Tax=Nostoc sp. CHAB 5836 TaxID=2780404 RepID=UPI001E5F40E2|nr:POTRA domain-containing protein [Nostoc sp. CHAB 5836]MCC5613768.1 BamA/TamA family outer membrane protein [Nostoc sp. CHAB 5836]